MTNHPTDIRSDLQRMYELSLAVGNSLDPNEVCRQFGSALMRQSELNYVGIWTLPEKHDTKFPIYHLQYAFPFSRAIHSQLPHEHPALQIDDEESFIFYSCADSLLANDPAEESTSDSFCALFRLGSLGYLRLLRDKKTFNLRELRQLRTLIEKFYIALKGALAYERLNTERIFLTSLINNIPDLVWLKNMEGVYVSCNSRFEEFFGALEHQIIGKTDYDFVDKELAEHFREKDHSVY